MKIFRFESLSSTSDYAHELLLKGEIKPPFAVIAREQSGGRGRTGKSWSSPRGGLYLTLVLDGIQGERLARLSLSTATAAAQWLAQTFKIRVTIKWPNDLLFGGAKLGGILCESSVQGQSWGPVSIGVGINLAAAPAVSDQRTVALAQLVSPQDFDSEALAESLATYLQTNLSDELFEQRASFQEFAIEDGQLWRDDEGKWAVGEGLDASGHLRVREIETGREHALSSVRHSWHWIYQERATHPVLALDIGNSLCKLGIFHDGAEPELFRFTLQHRNEAEREALAARLDALHLPRSWPVHAIAVRDALIEPLREWLGQCGGLRLHFLPKRSLLLDFKAYRFDELGIDRLALAEAAFRLYPRRNLIVVSAGTAVTIEVINAQGIYLGGYILPGLQTKLSALHLRTGRLPLIQLDTVDPKSVALKHLLGQDTRTAMLRGVLRETQFALRGLVAELGGSWDIVCTGGDGEFLSSLLEAPYDPHLILKGIKMMAQGG